MKVLITGVNGFIGSTLAERFFADGHSVNGVAKNRPSLIKLDAFVRAELNQQLDLEIFRGVDLVVHAAHDISEGAIQLNVTGTELWFNLAQEAKVNTQLFLTSYSAHPDAPSEYGRAKYLLEQFFLSQGGIVLRLGLVMGNGGVFAKMVSDLRRFYITPVMGGNDIGVALTDIETVSKVILGFSSLKKGMIYNLFQPEMIGLLDLARSIKHHFGITGICLPMPLAFTKMALKIAGKVYSPFRTYHTRLNALEKSQEYKYISSYDELALKPKPLKEMLEVCNHE